MFFFTWISIKLSCFICTMIEEIDLYNHDKLLGQAISNLDKADISKKNKSLVLKFQRECTLKESKFYFFSLKRGFY